MYSLALCGPTIYLTALFEQLRLIRGDIRVAAQSNHISDAPSLIAHSAPDAAIMISGSDSLNAVTDIARIRRVDLDVKLVWWALSSDAVELSRQLQPFEVKVVTWEASPDDMFQALGIPMSPLLRTAARPRLTTQEHTICSLPLMAFRTKPLRIDCLSAKALSRTIYVTSARNSTPRRELRPCGKRCSGAT